jgi:sugar lactone lactonase YvrE
MWSVLLACAPEPGGDPCATSGNICTWLGVAGEALSDPDGLDRLETHANLPVDLAFGPEGTLYFADSHDHRLRKVDTDGVVTTLPGTWDRPADVLVDPADPDTLWVVGEGQPVASIDLIASVVTWHTDAFLSPTSIVAADGVLYVADSGNHSIHQISADGETSTFAGEPGRPGYDGDGGPASQAHLRAAESGWGMKMTLDGRRLLVADTENGVIRSIDLDTTIIQTVAGRYEPSEATGGQVPLEPPSIPGYSGDGGPALQATLSAPADVAVGPEGELYIAETDNHCVRVVRDGVLDTFAGTCTEKGFAGDEGPAAQAQLDRPTGVAVGPDGAVYIADTTNQVIRRVAP